MGSVGEVAIGWSQNPNVLVQTNPSQYDLGEDWGMFRARETRPTEELILGSYHLPIMINGYTSALPDWPSRVLYALLPNPSILKLWHIALGGLLLLLILRAFPKRIAFPMSILLATDWSFLIYKHLLGGTEICLQLATIGLLWVVYHRKDWGWFIFWGLVGIQAKITFVFVLLPTLLCIFLFRLSLPQKNMVRGLCAGGILLLPFLISAVHHTQITEHVRSHDTLTMQWARIAEAFQFSNRTALREQGQNVWYWLLDPIGFYEHIYQIKHPHTYIRNIRIFGWLCLIICLFQRRKDKHVWLWSAVLCAQILFIIIGPKDLHHFAMIVPTFALWAAVLLGTEKRKIMWIAPFLCSSILFNIQTDQLFSKITIPTFSASKQQQLISYMQQYKINRLLTLDYEIYGLLEYHQQDIDIIHGWPAISHQRYRALPHLLEELHDGHVIILKASMPMIYNLRPSKKQLELAAKKRGLHIEDQLESNTISIYRVYRSATERP